MPRHPSLAPRLALPLAISLLGHALLIGFLSLLPALAERQKPAGTGLDSTSTFRIDIAGPRRRPRPAPSPDAPFPLNAHIVFPDVPYAPGPAPTATPTGMAGTSGNAPLAPALAPPPIPRFLAVPGTARRVVYVIDRSISMGPSGALDLARREVVASLRNLPPQTAFQVIAYNEFSDPLLPGDLHPAEPALIEQAVRKLDELPAEGSTHHVRALRRALLLRPDVLFLVTDADDLLPADVNAITRLNQGRTVIHVVELSSAFDGASDTPLMRLAAGNRGTYRRVRPGS